jgi:homoserine kinase type II
VDVVATVYVVMHSYELDECDETKFIGVYSSRLAADAAVTRLKLQPGFRLRPDDFHVDAYEVDQDHWSEGYVSLVGVFVPRSDGSHVVSEAELLPGNRYELLAAEVPTETWLFQPGQVVRCEERPDAEGDRHLFVVSLADAT